MRKSTETILSYVGKDWNLLSSVILSDCPVAIATRQCVMNVIRASLLETFCFVFVIVFYGNGFLWLVLVSVASSHQRRPEQGNFYLWSTASLESSRSAALLRRSTALKQWT